MVITFFAHYFYQYNERDERRVLAFLSETVGDKACDIYLGCFGRFDTFARKCCIEYKKTHPNVKLIQVLFKRKRMFNFYGYDEKLFLPLDDVPTYLAIQLLSTWMVEHADIVITRARYRCGFLSKIFEVAERSKKKIFNLAENE